MKKLLAISLSCLLAAQSQAQDIAERVPANASVIFRVNTNEMFSLVDRKEFSESILGKQMLKTANAELNVQAQDLSELGWNLNSSSYFFSEMNDSITYTVWLMPLSDPAKLDANMERASGHFSRNGDTRSYQQADFTAYYVWNDKMLCMVSGRGNYSYFRSSGFLERHGLEEPSYSFDVPMETVEIAVDTAVIYEEPPAEEETEATEMEEETEMEQPPAEDPYSEFYSKLTEIQSGLEQEWVKARGNAILNSTATRSAASLPVFSSTEKGSIADLWIENVSSLYSMMLPSTINRNMGMFNYGYSGMEAHLITGEKEAKITVKMDVDDAYAARFRKLSAKKTPKQFYKYLPADKMIGFVNYSVDTKAYLEMMPDFLTQAMSSAMGKEAEGRDQSFVGDLFSIIVDEDAVSKIIKGDLLFVLTDFSTKEVTYTDYIYDENFNTTAVEKTKMQQMPEFLMLVTTDDDRIVKKLLDYAKSYDQCTLENGMYKFEQRSMPFPIYVGFGNGLVAVSTSTDQVMAVQQGRSLGSISAEQKRMLKTNWFGASFSPLKLARQLESGEGKDELPADMMKLLKAAGDIKMQYARMKGNSISGEITMDVPADQKNGLAYLLNLMASMGEK